MTQPSEPTLAQPASGKDTFDPATIRGMFKLPGARNYIFTGLSALAMVFLVLFQRGSDLGGLVAVFIGAAGLILRWPSAPLFFLLLITYFSIFPFGLPPPDENPYWREDGQFRITDIVLTGSILVYLAAHYRLFSITSSVVPLEKSLKATAKDRRPDSLIRDGEISTMLTVAAVVVLGGQIIWLGLTTFEIDPGEGIPFRFVQWRPGMPPSSDSFHPVINRLILLVGLLFFGTLIAKLIFGYWRLRTMSSLEAGMLLQDMGWNENRRERVRIEKWRSWASKQVAKIRKSR